MLEDEINLDGIHITSFKSSHDAPDSRNYVFECDGKKLAYVTDTGYVNAKNFKYLKNLDIYLFESNHDIQLLMNGPYPEWLKRRVYSDEGHLSNKTASFYLTKLVGDKTKKIVLIHLSETNNLESIAMETINNTFLDYGIDFHDIICAKQDENGSNWNMIKILCVGKIKESYLDDLIKDYKKNRKIYKNWNNRIERWYKLW